MLNQFDIAFIIDTTSSMGYFINEAKRQMRAILEGLAKVRGIDMRVGIVEFHDHPPQDHSFVTKVYAFTGNLQTTENRISKLRPYGGGDWPEAVFDGVVDTCKKLKWREHARRIAILIGDAPPHGHCRNNYGWSQCPCGETMDSVTSLVEETCIRLFSIPLNNEPDLERAFKQLALLTGGGCFPVNQRGDSAMTEIHKIVESEFGHLDLDEKVHIAWHESDGEITPNSLAEQLEVGLEEVYDSLGRLGVRNLLEIDTAVTAGN